MVDGGLVSLSIWLMGRGSGPLQLVALSVLAFGAAGMAVVLANILAGLFAVGRRARGVCLECSRWRFLSALAGRHGHRLHCDRWGMRPSSPPPACSLFLPS